MSGAADRRRGGSRGSTMVELLLALPIVLLLGLGIAQFTLVYQAKHALDYALTQAARQGAVDHASPESIVRGFAAGMVPYLRGAENLEQLVLAEESALAHVEEGAAAGWVRLRLRSPTRESFEDWGEPALDAMGERIPGVIEIANDNLDSRRLRMQPASGSAGNVMSEPIGRLSGQTLADANLLRLELIYGVRLAVPLVGALIVRTLSQWHGCGGGPQPDQDVAARSSGASPRSGSRLGLLLLGTPERQARPQPWLCEFLEGDGDGFRADRSGGRIPLRASATVRMMSTARPAQMTQQRVDIPSAISAGEVGGLETPDDELPADGGFPAGAFPSTADVTRGPGVEASEPAANGFLRIGSDRSYGLPVQGGVVARHPALCPA